MKRPLLIFLIVACLMSLTACVGGNNTVSVSTLPPASASADAVPSASVSGTESAAPDTSNDTTADKTQHPQTSQPVAQASSSIIAESSNAVSDKEKEAILDNLSSQLDGMLNDSKSLDDIDSSDLDPNN